MKRGLSGKRVIITRATEQAPEFERLLTAEGAVPFRIPTIVLAPPPEWSPCDRALRELSRYDVVLFTSRNTVDWLWKRSVEISLSLDWTTIRVAAIGQGTVKALEQRGVLADHVPASPAAAEELRDELLASVELKGKKILFPRALEGRDVLVKGLEKAGATVELVPVYRTLPSEEGRAALAGLLRGEASADWATFASSSAVRAFFDLAPAAEIRCWIAERKIRIASLGRVTAGVLKELGVEATVTAAEPSLVALVRAMNDFEREGSQ